MVKPVEIISICKAAELLHYGVNILELDSLNVYYNPKTSKLQSRISDGIPNMLFKFTDEALTFLYWHLGNYVVRTKSIYEEVFEDSLTDDDKSYKCIEIDEESLKNIMMYLRQKSFEIFEDVNRKDYDLIYVKAIEESQKSWDYSNIDCPMVSLLNKKSLRSPLEILLTLSSYPEEVGEGILKVFDEEQKDFEIDSLKKFPIIDNRMYIKLSPYDMEEFIKNCNVPWKESASYIVISRNPYDWYFCSYGSNIQSCFSINSCNAGWYGMVPMSMSKGSYLVYITTGVPNKINIISNSKWNVPRMLWRCWGWLSRDNKLLLDRPYTSKDTDSNQRNNVTHYISNNFLNKINFTSAMDVPLKYGAALKNIFETYDMHTYPDSINFKGSFNYKGICYGTRDFVGRKQLNIPLLNLTKTVTSVSKSFKYASEYYVDNGILFASKRCPITNLPIPIEESKSIFADMFTKPVEKCIVVTYCDGMFKADIASERKFGTDTLKLDLESLNEMSTRYENTMTLRKTFSSMNSFISLKSFKETMTHIAKSSGYNIIVRFIEGDKVTYIKYKG